MRQCSFSNIVISNSWRGIAFDFPKKDPRNDFGREASLVEDMIFSNILMDNLYSCPIEASVSSDEEVLFEGVRNLYFTDIHASAINGVKMRALQDKPFKNLVFSNCTFKKVKQEDMDIPQDMLHRLKITNETPGDVFLNVEGLVLENTVFYNADGTVSQTYQ